MAIKKVKAVDNEGYSGEWTTVYPGTSRSNPVFIRDGETLQDALTRRILKDWEKRDDDIRKNKEEANKAFGKVVVEDYIDDYVTKQSDIGIGGGLAAFRKYMKDKGFDDNVVEECRQLLSEHSGYHYEDADRKIVKELESGSALGKALEARIDFEEASYNAWLNAHKNKADAYRSKIYDGKKVVYRKGSRKEGVEPWTSNEEGADMGNGGIGYDHESTVEDLMKQGYHILGGVAMHLGSPGEAEITFVKYKKR